MEKHVVPNPFDTLDHPIWEELSERAGTYDGSDHKFREVVIAEVERLRAALEMAEQRLRRSGLTTAYADEARAALSGDTP